MERGPVPLRISFLMYAGLGARRCRRFGGDGDRLFANPLGHKSELCARVGRLDEPTREGSKPVTAALAVAGTASLEWTASHDISNHNWAGVAYDAGSLVGGLATGIAGGPKVATSIDPNATPGWSPQSWHAQAYDPAKGYFGGWMGTGPTQSSAGVSTCWRMAEFLFGAGCH
jgi:hypothetical protein